STAPSGPNTLITSIPEQGSAGGSLVQASAGLQPFLRDAVGVGGATEGQYADYTGSRRLSHTAPATTFNYGGPNDDDFTVVCAFLTDGTAGNLQLYSTMAAVTASQAGFFARTQGGNSVLPGLSPNGVANWVGLVASPTLNNGWHFLACRYGSASYALNCDDMQTPYSSGGYPFSHPENGSPNSATMGHGTPSAGAPGGVAFGIWPRKLSVPELETTMSIFMGKVGLTAPAGVA
ncbi:MAG: hypothetical protein AAF715_28775, partial [Myxococcota bacterium]